MFVQHITRTHHDYKQTTNRSKTVKSHATGLSSNSINRPMRSSITLRICHTQLYLTLSLLSLRWFV